MVAPQDGSLDMSQPGTAALPVPSAASVMGADTAPSLTAETLGLARTALTVWKVGCPVILSVCVISRVNQKVFITMYRSRDTLHISKSASYQMNAPLSSFLVFDLKENVWVPRPAW